MGIKRAISARRLSGSSSVPAGRVVEVVSLDVVDSGANEVVVEPVVAVMVVVDAEGVHAHRTNARRPTSRRRGLTPVRLPVPMSEAYGPDASEGWLRSRLVDKAGLEALRFGHD